MAFDKNYVNYALKDWNVTHEGYSHTEDFIDKIIQVPLTIPKFNGEDFYEIFECKFKKVLNNHNPNVENFNMEKLYILLFPFLKTLETSIDFVMLWIFIYIQWILKYGFMTLH